MSMIHRDNDGLAEGIYCRETADGGIDLDFAGTGNPDDAYDLSPDRLNSPEAFAMTFLDLTQKAWFHDGMAKELTLFMAARWLLRPEKARLPAS